MGPAADPALGNLVHRIIAPAMWNATSDFTVLSRAGDPLW